MSTSLKKDTVNETVTELRRYEDVTEQDANRALKPFALQLNRKIYRFNAMAEKKIQRINAEIAQLHCAYQGIDTCINIENFSDFWVEHADTVAAFEERWTKN